MTKRKRKRGEGGFTLIEVMVALLLSAIATIGLLGLYRVQTRSSSYSRRSTEATVLAGDQMERLRTMLAPTSSTTDEVLDANGIPNASGAYTRRWFVTTVGTVYEINVVVEFQDEGLRTITLRSFRGI